MGKHYVTKKWLLELGLAQFRAFNEIGDYKGNTRGIILETSKKRVPRGAERTDFEKQGKRNQNVFINTKVVNL